MSASSTDGTASAPPPGQRYPVTWYRGTFYNMTILGLCNLMAPGIWIAMNSLGAGGAASPQLVNAANAATFCLMVVSCAASSALIHYIGIKWALVVGTLGYAPFAAGLYVNNLYGVEWLTVFGACLCGLSAGIFWAVEAAIAIAYPEPWNKGRALGWWLTFRLIGQTMGGAINLGLNADRDSAGKVSHTVYLVFIALQASGPFVALFLTPPRKVQRQDGVPVTLDIVERPWAELKLTAISFLRPKFLLILLYIGSVVFAEAVFFTYLALWFSVRARALGSFLGGVGGIIAGNILGLWIDNAKVSLKRRARSTFWFLSVTSGAWWLWILVQATHYRQTRPTYDWSSPGFGAAFGVYVLMNISFQINYMFLYFTISHIADGEAEIIRCAALLRGTESAWQAVSYGLTSLPLFAEVGGIYINFGLWAVAVLPAWLVIRHFGTREQTVGDVPEDSVDVHEEHLDVKKG